MIPELGHLALILALLLALIQGTVPLWGASRGDASLMALARPTAAGQMFFAALAFGCLAYAFLTNDFSIKNVAHNSFSQLPLVYRFTATWGSHEGSLLLWVLILAFWGGAVALLSRRLPLEIAARVLGVMGLVGAGLLSFLLFTSNPLVRLFPVPEDGADLNPLLQDPGMVLHPPVLYMGYVGFSVAFSFALAALLSGRIDAAWARWARPWTTVAWMFLTLGIALGSWWAYYELGWGGWWFWDPTENASLMPWLAGTALIHSLAVTEKRGGFKGWTLLLAIATFSLSLLGTFLVRSGVLSSVHAFATDPGRGLYILALLGAVIGGSLFLYGWRAPRLGRGGNFAWVSRESLLLGNNVLLVAALGSVLLGTLYPLALDAFGLGKVSVGPPYFNAVFVPLMAPALFLAGIGPLALWTRAQLPDLARRLRWAFGVALAAALVVPFIQETAHFGVGLGVFLGVWLFAGAVTGFLDRKGERKGSRPLAWWGMQLAHVGLGVAAIGATLVSYYATERDVRMAPGDHVELAGYRFVLHGVDAAKGPNYVADVGRVEVTGPHGETWLLHPEKRKYNASRMRMTEAAVESGLWRDLYVALGEHLGGGAWSVRVFHKPFVAWLWIGACLLALGGLLAAADRRYRNP